eukprot:CAMPEP_0171919680 /NCGR_PEP_ID=MMETSP0993-20121228/18387_1 /TAXON_ID=483369 /ORGANISM="non described non described, Strain CCMP2098" /LENGTH=81 /DNA_ID=CAMNT_0012556411 /DNA_START=40 /DNA_END=282 /DNA_ORIENTATION=-
MTRTAVDNMEIQARAGEVTEVTTVVEVIAEAAGMTEAAAYTMPGATVAATEIIKAAEATTGEVTSGTVGSGAATVGVTTIE